jgi:pimeloyl-ACP methyl ester carboxylesterase
MMVARLLRLIQITQWTSTLLLAGWLIGWQDWPLAATLAAALILPLWLHAQIIALDFLLAHWAGSPTPPAWQRGPAGLLKIYLRELGDSIRVFQWAQAWRANRGLPGENLTAGIKNQKSADSAISAGPIPVVLVHGYLCNRQIWYPMAYWLASRGHLLQAVELEPVFSSIDDYATVIDRAVRELQQRSGHERVALVCHSMGGLAARAYLRACPDAPIERIVTLGTPHRGTIHARFASGINGMQMRPDSDWLRTLAAQEDEAFGRRFSVILSHHDNIVAPQSNQTLPGARIIELGGLGHVSLVLDQAVWQLVAAELGR